MQVRQACHEQHHHRLVEAKKKRLCLQSQQWDWFIQATSPGTQGSSQIQTGPGTSEDTEKFSKIEKEKSPIQESNPRPHIQWPEQTDPGARTGDTAKKIKAS